MLCVLDASRRGSMTIRSMRCDLEVRLEQRKEGLTRCHQGIVDRCENNRVE